MKKEKVLRCSRCSRKLKTVAYENGRLRLGPECVKRVGVEPNVAAKPESNRSRAARNKADFLARQGVLFA